MKIHEEFARLQELASDPHGWAQIEKQFLSYENLIGFAIDIRSWKYQVGHLGESHIQPKKELLHALLQEMSAADYEKSEASIIQGRMVTFEDYSFPLLLFLRLDTSVLTHVEPRIIEMQIALPVGRLFLQHNPVLPEVIASTTAL